MCWARLPAVHEPRITPSPPGKSRNRRPLGRRAPPGATMSFALPSPFHQTKCLIFICRKGTAAMIAARQKPGAKRFAALFAVTSASALLLANFAALAADDLIVKYDQSQLLRLPRPASEIIIGNPAIADIAIQSGNLLVVTGKSFGITNIIALDAERNVIQDQRVLVRRDDAKVVNLQRGTERQTFNCTPQCNPSIVIGDDQKYFDMISKASQAKIGFSERAADSGAPAASQ
jgi:hypothetical protein